MRRREGVSHEGTKAPSRRRERFAPLSSFPRKREPSGIEIWVPAFAGTTSEFRAVRPERQGLLRRLRPVVARPDFPTDLRPSALALGAEPALVRPDHLAAIGTVFEVRRSRRHRHSPAIAHGERLGNRGCWVVGGIIAGICTALKTLSYSSPNMLALVA